MPMAGNRVWITRTAPGANRTAEAVREMGFEPVVSPLLATNTDFTPGDIGPLLDGVVALAFTSVNGLAFADLTPRRDWPVFTVGERTAAAARACGFLDVVSADGDASDLATLIDRQWTRRGWSHVQGVLLAPTASRPAADLTARLEGRIPVRTVVVYETVETDTPLPAAFEIVLVHSARAAEILARRLDLGAAEGRVAVALSQAVAAPLGRLGFSDLRIAARPDETSLLEALGKPSPAV